MSREVGSFRIRRLKNLLPLLCEWGERGLETDTLLDRCEHSSRRLLPLDCKSKPLILTEGEGGL